MTWMNPREKTRWSKRLQALLLAAFAFGATACGETEANADGAPAEQSVEADWTENYDEALAESKAGDRPMFLLFTGSDWCPPCMRLERRVLSSETFAEFAAGNLALMKADFPRGPQSEAIARQNQALQRQYSIRGYPTVLLIEPQSGKVIFAESGYGGQSPAAYVESLKAALAKQSG